MADQTSSRLLDQVRDAIRLKHYSIRTEEADVDWIKRFILFHKTPEGRVRHPQDMGAAEIAAFLTHLAVDKNVAASTQNQALRALLFFYRNVLGRDVILSGDALRAKKLRRLPTVLTKEEMHRVLNPMTVVHQLMARLLYGSGLRLIACVRLRVKDSDFDRHMIVVRDGKGEQDRVTILPDTVVPFLRQHLARVRLLHQDDLAQGYGRVYLPDALAEKYPTVNREWGRQYGFPADRLSVDPRSGITRCHHVDESGLQKAVRQAAKQATFVKP